MSAIVKVLQALDEGDVELLESIEVDQEALSDESVSVALRHSAERVVGHRLGHRDAIKKVINLGFRCDIWTASRAGLLEEVKQLLTADKDLLNAEDENGRTPLQRAALVYGACEECDEVVDYLLESGAKVDIFTASTYCMADVVVSELERAPNLVAQRSEGSTPLNWAVRPRRNYDAAPEICKALLDANADVHDPDKYESNMTPLHHAAEWGPRICLKLVDLLIAAGAEINAKDSQGWTALQYAKDRGRKEIVEHLTKLGAI